MYDCTQVLLDDAWVFVVVSGRSKCYSKFLAMIAALTASLFIKILICERNAGICVAVLYVSATNMELTE
jgi:hypothetical protein